MAEQKVLVADDEIHIVYVVAIKLRNNGYEVITAGNGAEAFELVCEEKPDIIVTDFQMPVMTGLELVKKLRQSEATKDIPVIMLTARDFAIEEEQKQDLQISEFISKPFSPKELAARVRTVLRRMPGERGPEEIKHEQLTVNFIKHEAFLSGRPLNLTTAEFRLLGTFVKEPDRVFSRAQLIEKAFGYDFEGFDRTIDVHILNLRRKIEPDSRHPRYIKTVYGAGYKLLEENSDT